MSQSHSGASLGIEFQDPEDADEVFKNVQTGGALAKNVSDG